jgi:hypothetical protein
MIKKITFLHLALATLLSGVFFSSCTKQFLDQTTTTDLNEQSVFSDSARTIDFLTQIYTNIDFSFNPARFDGRAGLDACSDEAEGPSASVVTAYNEFATGSVNSYSISADAWSISYQNIRAVNQYISHLPSVPFNNALKQRTRAEAIFLRAWYYSILLKHYGGVPIVGDSIYDITDKINTTRDTYENCVNYILAQCDDAASDLPDSYTGAEFGRVTRGACLALKSRVLLYAASPLFNGGSIAQADPLKSISGYPNYDLNRWKNAADAAKAVIDMNLYQLNEDNDTKPGYGFYEVFQKRSNVEYIFQKMKDPGNSFQDLELLWRPSSRGGSTITGSFPYQNMVDAFQMKNGKDITDPTSGYDPANPYANRDPRMDYTVSRNGVLMYKVNSAPTVLHTYLDESNGDGFGQGTPTGYYVNKMCDENVVPNWFNGTQRCYPMIRFAELLLNYAEALNEFSGPNSDVYAAVELIRKRAGLVPFNLPSGLTTEEMRSVIQHERQVELAFEEHRFWDVRRWKIAAQTDNMMMKGMRITNLGSNNYTYEVVNVRQHSFREPMYLWPIPQVEAAKSTDLLQNQGY